MNISSSRRLVVGNFNTWLGCAAKCLGDDNAVVDYVVSEASCHDALYLNEVHMLRKPVKKRFVKPQKMGHRIGPIDLELGNRIEKAVSGTHKVWFNSHFKETAFHDCEATDLPVEYGNMLLVKKELVRNISPRSFYLHGMGGLDNEVWENSCLYSGTPASRLGHTLTLLVEGKLFVLVFVHGLWSNQGKVDTVSRRAQNAQIDRAVRQARAGRTSLEPHVLLIGDLNYTSQMESLADLLRRSGFGVGGGVDLNARYNITDTRTKWYPEDKPSREADFALASANFLKYVTDCSLHRHAPSDHALLSVTIDLTPSF